MSKDNGGPAFPVPNDANVNGQEGMSLRDYFAAAALQGWIASLPADAVMTNREAGVAERCYKLADAMLAERAK
jgi:hypothetical protein